MRKPQHIIDAEAYANAHPRYVETATKHVWHDTEKNVYLVEDETNNFMEREYGVYVEFDDYQEAVDALNWYVKHYL